MSRGQLEALATRAEHDPEALARLRTVHEVDGQPVDLRASLAGASGDELRNRLREISGTPPTAGSAGGIGPAPGAPPATEQPAAHVESAAEARRAAQAVLTQRKFRAAHAPQPLRGVLRWLGDRTRPVLAPIGRWIDRVSNRLFGSRLAILVTCAALALGVVLLAVWFIRRRGRAAVLSGRWTGLARGEVPDPSALEARADEAERDGNLEQALRLRFLAGLTRLHLLGLIEAPLDELNGSVAGALASERFDDLAHTFDEVVYGRRRPAADDLDQARTEWPKVLEEQRR